MLTFALITSRTGLPLDPNSLHRLTDIASRGTFDPLLATPVVQRTFWANKAKTIAAVAWWSGHDPFESGVLWHSTPESFTAMSGHGWPRGEGWDWSQPWAPQLAAFVSAPAFGDRCAAFSGSFVACHLDINGGRVFSDPLGLGLIHTATNSDIEVFASRAAIAAHIVVPERTRPDRDPLNAGWLAHSQVMVDDTTGYADVEILPEATRVDIDASGVSRRTTSTHPTKWHEDGLEPAQALRVIRDDLTAEINAISSMRGLPLVCDLTGGKDSRVIFAMALEAGVADRFEYFTSGPETLGDVKIAKTLRERYNLTRHPVASPRASVTDWNRNQPSDLWAMYRQFSFATGGMQTLWYHRLLGAPRQRISVCGLGGEALSTNYPGSARLRKPSQLHDFLARGQRFGGAATASADAQAHYGAVSERLVHELFEGYDHVQDAVDRYYLRVRMRRWIGTGQEIDRNNRLLPLFGARSVAAAFALGHELRQAQFIPYELMRSTDPTLVTTPFADDTWPERLMAHVDTTGLTPNQIGAPVKLRGSIPGGDPGPPPRTSQRATRRKIYSGALLPKESAASVRRQKRTDEQIALFMQVMTDDPANPLFTVTDHAATVDLINNYKRLPHQVKQLVMGAFTAAVWLGEHDVSPYATD